MILRSWKVLCGDAATKLATLPTGFAHTCVTSPPYFGLRDYGTGRWDGGDAACDHVRKTKHQAQGATSARAGRANAEAQRNETFTKKCERCGAVRVDEQIGLEETPTEFLDKLVAVFEEVRRVLRDDGTLWLNMGDSYAGGGRGGGGSYMRERGEGSWHRQACLNGWKTPPFGLKSKDLIMMPARLAIALQAAGWFLRAEIVWAKKRPMPESVTDRPTKSHEMIYLLTKQEDYFYDGFAIREPVSGGAVERRGGGARGPRTSAKDLAADAKRVKSNPTYHNAITLCTESRNSRDVWTFDAMPMRGEEHYAAYPEELARKAIAAGTSERGVCATCAMPRTRIIEKTRLLDGEPWTDAPPMKTTSKLEPSGAQAVSHARVTMDVRSVGWKDGCTCAAESVPAIVLDPFCGSGTTGIVARAHGRRFIGIELSPKYAAMSRRRIERDAPLFNLEPRAELGS